MYRLARSLRLTGWVRNTSGVVEIHAQGSAQDLRSFGDALVNSPPATARARVIDERVTSPVLATEFLILPSTQGAPGATALPMDLYACEDCVAELDDPTARRFHYPFINCTQCGPRYTIITRLPYDRHNTTLDAFPLCRHCKVEYSDPQDRRFHAQPLACAVCGPVLSWHGHAGDIVGNEPSLMLATEVLKGGGIVAVRGVGGYHLLCNATNADAVQRLRVRKGRAGKPFAVMVPVAGSDDLDRAREIAYISEAEAGSLRDASRPIVLLRKRELANLAPGVAPALQEVGVFLPYSPLHHLLLQSCGFAVVATSGNITGEPVLTEPEDATARLAAIADGFLHHNRPIARHVDDGVCRMLAGRVRPLRLGRGSAPLEISLLRSMDVPTLAVGAHQKATVALAWNDHAIVSPHIGDLTTPRGRAVFAQIVHDLQLLYGIQAQRVVHDAHPQFASTRWAVDSGLPAVAVWHHHAHASALAGEFQCESPLLCFTWDGLGLGPDKSLWGGEALLGLPGEWRRVASFREFGLPGGERVSRELWRSALALCWESGITWPEGELKAGSLLRQAFDSGINAPRTTSVGRLFDAAAALVGQCHTSSYEAEGAMQLEGLCDSFENPVDLPLMLDDSGIWRTDWEPLLHLLLDDTLSRNMRAARFHSSLAHALLAQAMAVRRETGVNYVGLTGGVFQNRILTERALMLLSLNGFEVLLPQRLPTNDAAISFGQLIEVSAPHAR